MNGSSVANALKIYLFPSLLSIIAMLIWRDIAELRADVKSLLAQSNVDKTKIEILEREVHTLEQQVLYNKPVASSTTITFPERDRFYKHEEIFDVTKYFPKNA